MSSSNNSSADGPLKIQGETVEMLRGRPLPLGATLLRGGINFSLFSRHATHVTLALFEPGALTPLALFPLDPLLNRTGNIWHAYVKGIHHSVEYGYLLDRQPPDRPHLHKFDPRQLMLDPYARCITGGEIWGNHASGAMNFAESNFSRRRGFVVDEHFDWGDDHQLNSPMAETIIYELHVRGFTRRPNSGVAAPGTYAGLVERIPYLQALGITAVELLPVFEFEEADANRHNPRTGEPLLNFWGYHPINFCAPNAAYAAQNRHGAQVKEFKFMVQAFHRAGIEIILDVVFNHTAEGDTRGPTFSLRGLDNAIYYMLDPLTGTYANYSGCGNTVNCNHPVVRSLIQDCLHYWVTEMHVDGFRFDLASILGRGSDGSVLPNPPLLEHIARDPVLADTKIIAEAWDAGGLYQVGSFPAWRRWAEWNGKFRDDLRRFLKGDPGQVPSLASRLLGSPDLYRQSGRSPLHSINFVTCHDGFTLRDLVSYNEKHNELNGEENRDGCNDNLSWNCGHEGPVPDPRKNPEPAGLIAEVESLRRRQVRNFAALLFLSRGVPMMLAGDEFGRTQLGNNNAYCQDNELSWLDWALAQQNADLLRFFKLLIQFRKSRLAFGFASFEEDPSPFTCHAAFHGLKPGQPDWSWESRSLAVQFTEVKDGNLVDIYLMANAYWEPLSFELPALSGRRKWRRKIDTSLKSPEDIVEPDQEPALANPNAYPAGPRSVVVLLA
jgi:glycogen operon protein